MRQRQLIFLLVVVALAANAIGYLVFRARRVTPASERPSLTAERAVDGDREQRGQAQRQAGYQALLEGDYDKALIQLTEAKANLADKSSVEDLLRITDQLRAKAQARALSPAPASLAATAEVAPAPPPEAEADQVRELTVEVRPAAKPRPARRAPPPRVAEATHAEPTRPEPSRASRSEPVSPSPPAEVKGLLLVTSNPRGLLVHVDGVAADLTPMRSSVIAGIHRVALYDGDRKLFETLVDVTESRPTTVVRDLSQELSPSPPSPAPTSTPAPTSAPVTPGAATAREPVAAAPPRSAAPEGRGGLEITSPGLYAEIWVNGRPYGFPPATVRELPAGNAEVEVRINGVVKRARTVTVEPGRVTAVKITK